MAVGDIVDKDDILKEADATNSTVIAIATDNTTTTKETYVDNTGILDSGNRTEFSSGAVRDIQDDKGSEYLLPFKEVSEMMSWYLGKSNNNNSKSNTFQEYVFSLLDNYKNTGDIINLEEIMNYIVIDVYDNDTPTAIMQLAIHFKNGATKYSPRNWEKGMPVSNYISSFIRHLLKYIRGDQDEHHERAMLWNIICAIWTIRNFPELDDFALVKGDTSSTSISENASSVVAEG